MCSHNYFVDRLGGFDWIPDREQEMRQQEAIELLEKASANLWTYTSPKIVITNRHIADVKEIIDQARALLTKEPEAGEKRFPLLGNKGNIGSIPWWVAEQAYMVYANKYGDGQSLKRLAERGGFGIEELDEYYPEWRVKCDIIDRLTAELKEKDAQLNAYESRPASIECPKCKTRISAV